MREGVRNLIFLRHCPDLPPGSFVEQQQQSVKGGRESEFSQSSPPPPPPAEWIILPGPQAPPRNRVQALPMCSVPISGIGSAGSCPTPTKYLGASALMFSLIGIIAPNKRMGTPITHVFPTKGSTLKKGEKEISLCLHQTQ